MKIGEIVDATFGGFGAKDAATLAAVMEPSANVTTARDAAQAAVAEARARAEGWASQLRNSLPEGDEDRKEFPMFDGLMAYFPNALAEVSRVSHIGNQQHNPGEEMHWARSKSADHGNKIMRHLVDIGKKDDRGVRHSARLAWRALALLQIELERDEGHPMARGASLT